MYNAFIIGSLLWSLAAQAAPAPQDSAPLQCPAAMIVVNGACVVENPATQATDVLWAVTATGAAAGGETSPVSGAGSTVITPLAPDKSTNVQPVDALKGASNQTEGLDPADIVLPQKGKVDVAAGATSVNAASPVQSAQAQATGGATAAATDATCIDDKPNGLVDLKKSFEGDEWKLTSKDCPVTIANSTAPRYVAYWSEWAKYDQVPSKKQLEGVTHLVLGFAKADGTGWVEGTDVPQPFSNATLATLKTENPTMKLFAAFGGWNLDTGFSIEAAKGDIEPLAGTIVQFAKDWELDGIDLDWEFPSGGGAFYKSCKETSEDHLIPERKYEFDAYLDLVRHIRAKGPQFELSVAVPGRALDQNYFPKSMVSKMDPCVDHFNLMSYDAMNRRDSKTAHHSGSAVIGKVIDFYDKAGMTKKKMNMGFASFAKAFTMPDKTGCPSPDGLGCTIEPAELPAGQDPGTSIQFLFDVDQNPLNSSNSVTNDTLTRAHLSYPKLATEEGTYDEAAGAHAWIDKDNKLFWTWTTPEDIKKTCDDHGKDVGGVMLWSINQDDAQADGGTHIAAIAACAASMGGSAGAEDSTGPDPAKTTGNQESGDAEKTSVGGDGSTTSIPAGPTPV